MNQLGSNKTAANNGFVQAGLDGNIINILQSQAVVQAGHYLINFSSQLQLLVLHSAWVVGGRISNPPPAQSRRRWLPLNKNSMNRILKLMLSLFSFSVTAVCQTNEWYTNYSNGGLCSTSIKLNKDGTYNYESGCEASSHISFGNWVQKKDTIKFKQIDTKDFKILKITPTITADQKILSVKVFDQTGKNITHKINLKQYVKGKGFYNMSLDSTKTKRTDFLRDSGIIILGSLQKLLTQNTEVKAGIFNTYEIILNVPNDWIYKIDSRWINIGNFELLMTKSSLLSINPDYVDENGELVKIEYKKSRD